MRSESPLSSSDGDLYRSAEVQLSPAAHTNKDGSTPGARGVKGDGRDGERRRSDVWLRRTLRGEFSEG